MLPILNTSIVTSYGTYTYQPINAQTAVDMVKTHGGIKSHVGHQAAADCLTTLLGTPVPMSREPYNQGVGDIALVFKLNGRLEEGRIIQTVTELEAIGYSLGILIRLS